MSDATKESWGTETCSEEVSRLLDALDWLVEGICVEWERFDDIPEIIKAPMSNAFLLLEDYTPPEGDSDE